MYILARIKRGIKFLWKTIKLMIRFRLFPRKEVIQPQLPLQLPCYDFIPVTDPTLGSSSLAVRSPTSGVTDFHDVTGGVYKARERIHRTMLTRGY